MVSLRKSLLSSQLPSSNVPINSTQKSDFNPKSYLVDISVDEIFVQYSVPQIQKLQRKYKENFMKAKDDLHRLVGEKYRDLIRIAEDIDDLSAQSHQIDSQLTELSYKSSNHVEFGKNSFSSFESTIRKQRARKSRLSSHKTILNNVINNKLIGYDLKLQTDSLKKTSTLVSVAKLYYTIESIFGNTLEENPHVSANLHQLKGNFIAYLESKISSFSSPSSEIIPGGLEIDNFFVNDTKFSLSEGDTFELFAGTFEDEDHEASDEEDSESPDTFYRGSTNPVANYLIAYIIVNHDDPNLNNLEKITAKFIDLRYSYLDKFVKLALESDKYKDREVNFTMIFQFIETTCMHLHKYFMSDDMISNDLQKQLKNVVTWKAFDLIGFHNWFEEETVVFDNSSYQVLESVAINSVLSRLLKFGQFVYQLGSKLVLESYKGSISQKATKVLNLFCCFVLGLRKSEVVFLSNTSECHSVKLISTEDVVSKLLLDVVKAFNTYFIMHRERLCESAASIMSHIISDLETDRLLSPALELFTPDFVNLIDVDVDKYFESVLDISSATNPISELEKGGNSCQELKHWFFILDDLLKETTIISENNLGRISRVLSRDFKDVKGLSKSWGNFSSQSFLSTFDSLHKQQIDYSRNGLESFVGKISLALETCSADSNPSKLHFLLNLYIILKDNINTVESEPNGLLDKGISKQVLAIYNQIFEELPLLVPDGKNLTFEALLRDSSALVSSLELTTVPTKPHLAIHSTLFELARSLLKSPRFRQHEMCNLYTDSGVRDSFIDVKNQWIKHQLIEKTLIAQIKNGLNAEENHPEISLKDDVTPLSQEVSTVPVSTDEDHEVNGVRTDEIAVEDIDGDDLDLNDNWGGDNEDWSEDEKDGFAKSKVKEQLQASTEKDVPSNIKEFDATQPKHETGTTSHVPSEFEKKVVTDELSAPKVANDSNENGLSNNSSLRSGQIRQALANIVFLLNFTTEGSISDSDPDLKHFIASLEEKYDLKFEHSTIDFILRGVNEFYRSNKEMYLPLLVN